jgi:hypothetical protein
MRNVDHIQEARGRLNAANDYISDFKMKVDMFTNSKPYNIIPEVELNGETKIFRYRFMVSREISAGLRTPVRACIAELREILDNLVWGLSQHVGEPDSCKIAFPTFLTEHPDKPNEDCFDKWFRKYRKVLSKFPTDAQALIRQLQPFNPDKRWQRGKNHPIYVLNKLAVQTKHKMPLCVVRVAGNVNVSLKNWTLGTVKHPPDVFEHNSIILEIPIPANKPAGDLEFKVATQIIFDKEGPAHGQPVYDFLVNMHGFVKDEVIAKFEPFF